MRLRRNRTFIETCVFGGCFFVVVFSVMQILVFTHRPSNATVEARTITGVGGVLRKLEMSSDNNAEENERKKEPNLARMPSPKIRARVRMQNEIRKMERSLTALLKQNKPSPEDTSAIIQAEKSSIRLGRIIQKAQSGLVVPFRANGSRLNNHVGHNNVLQLQQLSSHNSRDSAAAAAAAADGGGSIIISDTNNSKSKSLSVPSAVVNAFNQSAIQAIDQPAMPHGNPPVWHTGLDKQQGEKLRVILNGWKMEPEDEAALNKVKREEASERSLEEAFLKRMEGNDNPQLCRSIPATLVGRNPKLDLNSEVDIADIIKNNSDVSAGGEWQPGSCTSRFRLAIIIPYRDRWTHLKVLLQHLVPLLKRQQIHFRIFVVEQHGNGTFNKGRIMNAAYLEALKLYDFQCVTFHDVDLVPEDDRNIYSCSQQPKHMSISIDKFSYVLPYAGLVGGVLTFRTEHFQKVNGYSNMYWGWGGEDDDMTARILHNGLRIQRPPSNIATYKMVKHGSRKTSDIRLKLMRSAAKRGRVEGLNNVPYTMLFAHPEKLFTHFMVDIGTP